MTDLLIKGMEMPTECLECPIKDCDNAWDFGYTRPEDCPLVEIEPHGRLVDIDKLKKECGEKGVNVALTLRDEGTVIACTAIPLKQFFDLIDEQPTVLEASK